MQIVRFSDLDFIPASHEDQSDPGALKKVLLTKADLPEGKLQMINWAKIPQGKSFAAHYHEAMVEVFIMLTGEVKAKVDKEEEVLKKGDCLVVPEGQVHTFENIGAKEADYLCFGIILGEGGKTITV